MTIKKRPRSGPSHAATFSGSNSSFDECFRSPGERECFNKNFATSLVNTSRILDLDCLEMFNFHSLPILREWQWLDFIRIFSPT